MAAAKAHPAVHVSGIDLSIERFTSTTSTLPHNLKLRAGDASAIPFPDDSFDLVYCRFLLEYLAQRDEAVREMVRVCRPGGQVLLQDLDGQLLWHFPEDAELQQQLDLVLSGLAKTGFDPFIGRKLFSIARAAGLEKIEVSAESYHLFAGSIDEHNEQLWEAKLDIAVPAAEKILGSHLAAMKLKDRFLDYLRDSATLTYSVQFTVIGRKAR
jgi:ubiquinone/menaquinone biosynthesis C-methylase UbiE